MSEQETMLDVSHEKIYCWGSLKACHVTI